MPDNHKITKLEVAVFGDRGNEGLLKRVASMHDRVRKLELGHAKLIATAGVLAGLVSGVVVALAVKLLGG